MPAIRSALVRRSLLAAAAVALLGVAQAVTAQSGSELATSKKCMACHKMADKAMGPSIKELGSKYRGAPDAVAVVAAKIRQGGTGVWGNRAMKPQEGLSDAELKALATWILEPR